MRGTGAARRRFRPSSCLFLAALLSSGSARAADDAVSLTWTVPEDLACVDSRAVLEGIHALIGPAISGDRPWIVATATVTRVGPDLFHLELTTRLDAALGHRSLDARSCQALADATALILAWMIDPNAMASRSSNVEAVPAPAPPVVDSTNPVPPARASTGIPATSAVVSRVPVQHRGEVSAALDFVLDAGTLPRPQMGLGGHLIYRFAGFLSVDARASYWPRSPASSADSSLGGLFSLLATGAALCATPHVTVAFCAGPEVDWMRGESVGARRNEEGSNAWISLDIDGVVRIPIVRRLRLIGLASWIVPSKRQFFVVEGVGLVYRPSAVAGRGAMGLEALF